ncbi:MAG: endonuclease/exonuclease/phosphatase family protein [Kofleriaceae bacterium]|nr:endonuclease/exonuclease/phosphatase family protein [Kofleriaceae bacterium]
MSVYRNLHTPRDTTRLRVVTLNLWGLSAPLDRRLALTIAQLRQLDPDVICLQEVRPLNGANGPTTADALATALGMHAEYRATMEWAGQSLAGSAAGQEGLAVLTRSQPAAVGFFELPQSRAHEGRGLLSVLANVEHGPIWIHTTHLHYRLDDGVAREEQVVAVDEIIRNYGRDNDSAPQILCGDFNATPDSDEIRFLRGLTTLPHGGNRRRTHFQDAWLRLHCEPERGDGPLQGITWSSDNEHTRPLRSLDIDRRIDYIFVTSRKRDGRASVLRCDVVMTEREGEGADAICASDHYGVMADIQIAASAPVAIPAG